MDNKPKSMLITWINFFSAPTPIVTIKVKSGETAMGSTLETAIRVLVADVFSDDWVGDQIASIGVEELIRKYNFSIDEEMIEKWSGLTPEDATLIKLIPKHSESSPIILTKIRNLSDSCIIKVKAEFTHEDKIYRLQTTNVGDLLVQMATEVYGVSLLNEVAANNNGSLGTIIKMLNIQVDPKICITDMFPKSFTEFLSEALKNSNIQLPKEEKKMVKMGRITLKDIDLNDNQDWVVSLTIENDLMAPFNIKYVVTSRNNTAMEHRYDAIRITRNQIIGSLPLTLNMETELRDCTDTEFRGRFDMVVGHAVSAQGFPKNNHGGQMLGLIDWVRKNVVKDAIGDLVHVLFDPITAWDPDAQGMKNISGKAENGEVSFRICHAVGNHFVEGNLETVKLRVFKTDSTIQAYVRYDDNEWGDRPNVFNINNTKEFEEWLRFIVKSEIENRNSQSK